MVSFIRYALSVVVAAGVYATAGPAEALDTFSVFSTPDLQRQVHGQQHRVDLSAGTLALGDASAFFGVDSLSDSNTHYLSSGVIWQSEDDSAAPLLSAGLLHTVARGAQFGNQTLMRATARTDWGGDWFLPNLIFGVDQLDGHNTGGAELTSRASHLGFGDDFGAARYRFSYFRTAPAYAPWGSDLKAGVKGTELSTGYTFASGMQLSNSLRVHEGAVATATPYGVVGKWQLTGARRLLAPGRPWRVSARVGDNSCNGNYNTTPLSLAVALPTRRWRTWQFDSGVGWYQGDISTPDDMPITGGLWRVSASHDLNLAGLRSRFQPSFSVGGSRYGNRELGSRLGLALAFPGVLDRVAVSVDYLSTGWGPDRNEDDVQFMLTITQNAGAVLSRLGGLVDRFRN